MREGCDFDECDDNEKCEIIGASFRGEAVEWRRMPSGEVKCIAFVDAGKPIPTPRCSKTADMFESPNPTAKRRPLVGVRLSAGLGLVTGVQLFQIFFAFPLALHVTVR